MQFSIIQSLYKYIEKEKVDDFCDKFGKLSILWNDDIVLWQPMGNKESFNVLKSISYKTLASTIRKSLKTNSDELTKLVNKHIFTFESDVFY